MAYLVLMERASIGELTTTDAEDLTVTDRSAFRIAARMRSFRYAVRGIRAVFQSQRNAWIQRPQQPSSWLVRSWACRTSRPSCDQ